MLSKEVKRWLTDCKSRSSDELSSFASTLAAREELILGLIVLFDTSQYHAQELDPVCHQLYEFYRSKEKRLKQFSLQFAPALVWLYLRCVSHGDEKVCGGVETFLLGVYNLELIGLDGSPVVESVRVPTINKASIYHESRCAWIAEPLTERALHSLSPSQAVMKRGPFPHYERFNAENRFIILSCVMQHYNTNIDSFHTLSLEVLCKVAIKLSNAGFNLLQESDSDHHARISVNHFLLLELLFAAHFALFNGHQMIAIEAVKAVHQRSSYELYSDVLLVTNAILNSCCQGHPHFQTTNISLGVQKTALVLKNSVTNASFKAKKLPDDIDVVEEVHQRLPVISEDQEYTLTKGLKTRLMNFGGKFSVDKNKNRNAVRHDGDNSSPKQGSRVEFPGALGMTLQSPNNGGGGKGIVDTLEPQRSKGNGSRNDRGGDSSGIESKDSYGKTSSDGKQIRISPSTIVFSKRSGILKQITHGTSGLITKTSESSVKVSQSVTSTVSASQPSAISPSPSTLSVNGKVTPDSNNSITNSTKHYSPITYPETIHSSLAQSENSSQNESSPSSVKSPTSLLSSISKSFSNTKDIKSHNLTEPLLAQHSSTISQPPTSGKSHSTSAEVSLINRKRQSHKPYVNRNSYSTDL